MSHPDLLIVGSGLTGLIAAASAKRSGLSVRVIEAREVFGGSLRSVEIDGHHLPASLEFVPRSQGALEMLDVLKNLLPQPFDMEEDLSRALTFENGGFKPFVGFGETSSAAIDELSRINGTPRLELNSSSDQWIASLLATFSADELLPLSSLTGLQVQDRKVTQIQINGAKWLAAKNFIFTGSTTELERLLPEGALTARTRSKLAKAKGLTAISLHFVHPSVQTTEMGFHFLAGTSGETDPLVGRFFPATEATQRSSWMALIADDHTDDESIGQMLRYMKRQIKRAYPAALDGLFAEKIVITPESHGNFSLPLKENGLFAEIENLFLATPRISPQAGLLAAVERGLSAAAWAMSVSAIPVAAPEPLCYSATT